MLFECDCWDKFASGLVAAMNGATLGEDADCWSKTGMFIIVALGALWVVSLLVRLVKAVWVCVRPAQDVRKLGKWAVVTGATDGIGYAMAEELARKGMSIVLISRTQSKLEASKRDIEKAVAKRKHKVEVRTIQVDFASDADPKLYERIAEELEGLEIGVLVNNVGISYPYAKYLSELSTERLTQLIELNVIAASFMTKIVVPGMMERKRGAILNVGSAAGHMKTGDPLYSVYSGTKAYISFFSRSLHHELSAKGITVQNQVPYFVVSKLSKMRRPTFTVPLPKTYAKSAVRSIGYEPVHVPFWQHRLMDWIINALPYPVALYLLMNHHHGIRKAGMRKEAKKAAANKAE